MLSNFLDPDLSRKLLDHLKIPVEEPKSIKKREQEQNVEPKNCKRQKMEPLEDYSKNVKKDAKVSSSLNAKQKALAKNATGTKSITSFFKKK